MNSFYSETQREHLKKFADLSDLLFELGVISTDSFTGEIAEYYACRKFDVEKSFRVTKAIDGISKNGDRYQIKSKIAIKNFNFNLQGLDEKSFDYLVIVFFDLLYAPIKILRIPSLQIINGEIKISSYNINKYENVDVSNISIPITTKNAITEFAKAYLNLQINSIIRSRCIVGDIGEFYACDRLNLKLNENKNEKGVDARNENGFTFEIKTRRVHESARRKSETRRINNLVGKSSDYLVIVVLDRSFSCSGMWLVPMQNISNPKSANLRLINKTPGILNLIPSKIAWLNTGEPFIGFYQ
jgi:hypothetical protein